MIGTHSGFVVFGALSALALFGAMCAAGGDTAPPVTWNIAKLFDPPQSSPAPAELQSPGVQAIFYEGPSFQGKPTRVFAYWGMPADAGQKRVPGMVLVHGGGGTAFADWVRLWNKRGYAAIAMDVVGGVPDQQPNALGGPAPWDACFAHVDDQVQEQWVYHAVANVILAHSFLRTRPGVAGDRIGLTGISWGGYLVCIVAAADPRFRFTAPVYGCGYLGEHSAWSAALEAMGDQGRKWLNLWDPKHYLGSVRTPMLWVSGTNDFAYPLESLQASYRLPPGPRTICIRVRMPHGHGGAGENPEEIRALADHLLFAGPPLARITGQGRRGRWAWATFTGGPHIVKAELNFTRDRGIWQRAWETTDARLDRQRGRVAATLPEGVTAYYLNLVDERGLVVSAEHDMVLAGAPE